MGWGSEGWSTRLEAFETLVDENGNKIFPYPEGLPLVQNEELWKEVEENLPESPYYSEFLKYAKEPIPLSGAVIPGFQTFLDEVYFNGEYGNVEQAAAAGELNPNDIAKELTELLNQYHEAALREIF